MCNLSKAGVTIMIVMAANGLAAQENETDISQENPCLSVEQDVAEKAQEIKDSYNPRLQDLKDRTEAGVAQIKENAPEPDNAIEGAIQFGIDVGSHNEDLIFHLPSVTMRDQTISLDLPRVTMRTQDWSFDVPEVTMGVQCVNGPPETVCRMRTQDVGFGVKIDIPECYMRAGDEICTDVPEIRMITQTVKLDVPEFTVDRTQFILGIPEITMEEQRVVLTLPDITITNVRAELSETQRDAQALAESARQESARLSASYQSELEQAGINGVREVFECHGRRYDAMAANALVDMDRNIAIFTASLEKAREVGATETVSKLETSVNNLIARRDGLVKTLADGREQLNTEMETALRRAADPMETITVAPEPVPM